MIYKCKHCGKEFSDRYKLTGHSTWCEKNPKFSKEDRLKSLLKARSHINSDKKKKDNTELICQYCGKICMGKNSLINHERFCKNNPNRAESPFVKYNKEKDHAWNKGLSTKNNISIRNQSEQLKKHWSENDVHNKGKKMSVEQKEKIRNTVINNIKELKGSISPMYSKKACDYIDKLNDKYGWKLQHAENGGEYEFFGYFPDGYDKENNIIFEYDEKQHYQNVWENILKDKDLERQNILIERLNCRFFRYNEELDYFYEVFYRSN